MIKVIDLQVQDRLSICSHYQSLHSIKEQRASLFKILVMQKKNTVKQPKTIQFTFVVLDAKY